VGAIDGLILIGESSHPVVATFLNDGLLRVRPLWVIRYRSDPTRMSGFARSGHELIAKISRSAKKRHLPRAVGVRIEKTSVGHDVYTSFNERLPQDSLRQLRTAHSYHGAFCATFRDPPFSEIAGLGGAGRVAERPEPTPAIFLSRRLVGAARSWPASLALRRPPRQERRTTTACIRFHVGYKVTLLSRMGQDQNETN
jgi:hypothetical protein